jgi:hypothetical protein
VLRPRAPPFGGQIARDELGDLVDEFAALQHLGAVEDRRVGEGLDRLDQDERGDAEVTRSDPRPIPIQGVAGEGLECPAHLDDAREAPAPRHLLHEHPMERRIDGVSGEHRADHGARLPAQ